ncbi:hypothetical protein JYT83_00095 [bacterium AH-315-F18]|nr:hypothetical protein [bacterium AH-315-F18]
MKIQKTIFVICALAACLSLTWPLHAGDAFEAAPNRDALDTEQNTNPARAARKVLATPKSNGTKLYLFITLDSPQSAKAIRAGRLFEEQRSDTTFEPILLADLNLLQKLKKGGSVNSQRDLYQSLKSLSDTGESLPMVGTVPLARKFGIKKAPSFVLVRRNQAHVISGIPNLETFIQRSFGESTKTTTDTPMERGTKK